MIDNNLTSKLKSEMTDDERVRSFQRKLYFKAKQEQEFRFYVLYDKVYLDYFLREAWRRVKSNDGVAGYDKVSISSIEKYGVAKYLAEIAVELLSETYKAQPVLRVYTLKSNGKKRPLGIPTVRDRIVQMSCKMIIEPIFEADFEDSSYGFRPTRSAHDAARTVHSNLKSGKREVYDADLSSYFDNIPHAKLMTLIERRITDKRILKLIKQWLKAPIFEDNKLHKNKKGTPQGGVISPLFGNIYLNLLDKAVIRQDGFFHKYGISIVRYADDFILMASKIPKLSLDYLQLMLDKMELSVNEEKTHLLNASEESINFVGFTFRYDRDLFGKRTKYLNIVPRKESEEKIRFKVKEYLHKNGHKNPQIVSNDLNRIIRGWLNFITIDSVSYPRKAKRELRWYLSHKLYRFYQRKSQRKCKLYRRNAFDKLVNKYGLINPVEYKYV